MDPKDSSASAAHTGRYDADLNLMRLGRDMRLRVRSRMPLTDVLRELGERMAAEAVLLVVPGCRLKLAVGVREKELSVTIASEFDSLAARLATQPECPEGMPRILQGDDADAACRMLI